MNSHFSDGRRRRVCCATCKPLTPPGKLISATTMPNGRPSPFDERDGFPTRRCGLDVKSGIGRQRADRVAPIIIVLKDEDGRAF